MRPSLPHRIWLLTAWVVVLGCQDYEYVFQPDTDREASDLEFTVQQPSKADILFVIDNSRSMRPKQEALKASIGQMLAVLAPQDTAYRIGIVSTDAQGDTKDCCGAPISQSSNGEPLIGAAGSCRRCDCVIDGTWGDCNGNSDCVSPEVCNQSLPAKTAGFTGRCVQDCTDDTDCPASSPLVYPDAHQFCDQSVAPVDSVNFKGRCFGELCYDCQTSTRTTACADQLQVDLARSHDGARGRLIAAYDREVFSINATGSFGQPLYPVTGHALSALTSIFAGITTDADPPRLMPWVIDRVSLRTQACGVCAGLTDSGGDPVYATCNDCSPTAEDPVDLACYTECAEPVTQALVTAYFNSNANGLGIDGFGWEEGIKSAMLAVGIDPLAGSDQLALDPGSYLTATGRLGRPDGPNTLEVADAGGVVRSSSWIRPDALLAIMFVTDEEDCSMPNDLLDFRRTFEKTVGEPEGSICYQQEQKAQFILTGRMADLLKRFKNSASRLAIGVIGGVRQAGPAGRERRVGAPSDCAASVVTVDVQPSQDCACLSLTDASVAAQWCRYTVDKTSDGTKATCDGLAGYRYVDFASEFRRKTFDSICRSCAPPATPGGPLPPCDAFGAALEDFARLATLACFELGNEPGPDGVLCTDDDDALRPAGCCPDNPTLCDPSLIEVRHASGQDMDAGLEPTLLPRLEDADAIPPDGGAWFYDAGENMVCLLGLDRAIGDYYDIFVLHRDDLSFAN